MIMLESSKSSWEEPISLLAAFGMAAYDHSFVEPSQLMTPLSFLLLFQVDWPDGMKFIWAILLGWHCSQLKRAVTLNSSWTWSLQKLPLAIIIVPSSHAKGWWWCQYLQEFLLVPNFVDHNDCLRRHCSRRRPQFWENSRASKRKSANRWVVAEPLVSRNWVET